MSRDKLKWAAFGLVMGIIGGGIGAAAADKWFPGKIVATEIVILNEAGKEVALLGASGGGKLILYNQAGEPGALLGVSDGGILTIFNEAGKQVALLDASPSGGGLLSIYNAAGKKSAVLFAIDSGGGAAHQRRGGETR